jgi:hypothetical protein
VEKPGWRFSWRVYSLVWAGVVGILLYAAVLTARFEGDSVDWPVVIPLAVLIPAGSIAGAVYGNWRSDRR